MAHQPYFECSVCGCQETVLEEYGYGLAEFCSNCGMNLDTFVETKPIQPALGKDWTPVRQWLADNYGPHVNEFARELVSRFEALEAENELLKRHSDGCQEHINLLYDALGEITMADDLEEAVNIAYRHVGLNFDLETEET